MKKMNTDEFSAKINFSKVECNTMRIFNTRLRVYRDKKSDKVVGKKFIVNGNIISMA